MNAGGPKDIKIGVFLDSLLSGYHQYLWKFIQREAIARGISVQCFCIGVLGVRTDFHYERSKTLELAAGSGIQAGIVFTSMVGYAKGERETLRIIRDKINVPVIAVSCQDKDTPSVNLDNETGISELVNHCLDYHNYEKYLIIKGPEKNYDARDRYDATVKYFKMRGPYSDDKFITLQWDYERVNYMVEHAVKIIINDGVDSVIAFDDESALLISEALESLGANMPAIFGFDNIPAYLKVFPGLTTINQPVDLLVKRSFDFAEAAIFDRNIPAQTRVPTRLVVRTSCGCSPWKFKDVNNFQEIKDRITASVEDCADKFFSVSMPERWKHIMTTVFSGAIYKDIMSGSDSDYTLPLFQSLLLETASNSKRGGVWGRFIDNMENKLNDIVVPPANEIRKRTLFYNLRDFYSNFYENIKLNKEEQSATISIDRRFLSDGFLTAHSYPELADNLFRRLPNLGVSSFMAYIYDSEEEYPNGGFAIGYNKLEREGYVINKDYSGPVQAYASFLSEKREPSILLVMALYHADEYIGYAIYEARNRDSSMYETVTNQIANVVNSVKLFKKIKAYSINLEEQVRERTARINKAVIELEDANKRLKNIDQIKNDFILNITHDFRSPLTVINSLAELALINGDKLNGEIRESFDVIYSSGVQLKKYIDQLLELSRIDVKGVKLNRSKVCLNAFLENLISFYKSSLAGTNIKIESDICAEELAVFTDIEKLEEIIHNVFSNAVKFVDNETGIIKLNLIDLKESVLISIADNGTGIRNEYLEAIFKRFESMETRQSFKLKSTGIGLAYSLQLTEALGGKIWAESEGEGKGSEFFIKLPKGKVPEGYEEAACEDNPEITGDEYQQIIKYDIMRKDPSDIGQTNKIIKELNKDREYDIKKALILIVEDDLTIRNIIREYLAVDGFANFLLAADGIEALELYDEYGPDIIVSDYHMPNMMGDELHDRILSKPGAEGVPFIFLSAIVDKRIALKRKELGAVDYLKKPIDSVEFLISVNQQLKRYFSFRKAFEDIAKK